MRDNMAKKCSYCGKEITKWQAYGILASGMIVHDSQKNNCYQNAFINDRKWKGKFFRLKNRLLCFIDRIKFFMG
jgi:hypothetical protein